MVLHTQPTGTGYIAAHTHKYGTGKLPIPGVAWDSPERVAQKPRYVIWTT
ncbi:hypothetical protein OG496_26110 [Streptomyces sp. NBC_00988]|nr:hypothetical protein OG496_26110 [Streptomyces sp. NBC_00988]